MGSSAQLLRNEVPERDNAVCVSDFIEIIRLLGFQFEYEEDVALYIWREERWKGIRVYLDQEEYPIYTINGDDYYREAYFEMICHDEESMNSDMLLAIVMEYMKKYPDSLFHSEGHKEPFFDKKDIEAVAAKPFHPGWYYLMNTHLQSEALNRFLSQWTITGLL